VASRLAVDVVENVYSSARSGSGPRQALERAVKAANSAVHARSHSESRVSGMGTTCTAVAVVGRELYLAHVGDSRAYLVRPGSIAQLTTDHSLAAEMQAMGGSMGGGGHNLLTRSLGAQADVQVDTLDKPVRLETGVCLLLCSDGLCNMVDDAEILEILTHETTEEACELLIELARQRGGPDNITAIAARLTD
jgi:protein phosphatase